MANAIQLQTVVLSTIRNSGIVTADAQMNQLANQGGTTIDLPFWGRIGGNSNVSSDDPAQASTPNKIAQGKDIARKLQRNNSWSSADLVAALLADDPIRIIRDQIANYWVEEEQGVLVNILNGVFAASSMSGNVLSVAVETTAGAVKLTADVISNARALLGDQGSVFTGIMMHSRVYWNLDAEQQLIYLENPAGAQFPAIVTYKGLRVIQNDKCPKVAGTTSGFKYTSYLFGQGAIAYAEATGAGGPKTPVAVERAESAGNGEGVETLYSRRHWLMHPRGVKFTSASVAGTSPTNAELATGTNWTLVYDPKLVRLAAVVTNG
jgi:hypothetical protein